MVVGSFIMCDSIKTRFSFYVNVKYLIYIYLSIIRYLPLINCMIIIKIYLTVNQYLHPIKLKSTRRSTRIGRLSSLL